MRAEQGQGDGDGHGEQRGLEDAGEEREGKGVEEVGLRGLVPLPAEEDGLERGEGVLVVWRE